MTKSVAVAAVLMGLAGCGKSSDKGSSSAPEGGPACEVAVAAYVKNLLDVKGNYLVSADYTPTPEQVTIVSTKLVEHCTTTPWSAQTKECLTTTTDKFKFGKCFGDAMDSAQVSQVIHDVVKDFKAGAKPAVDVLANPKPGPPELLGGIKIGMPAADAAKLAPGGKLDDAAYVAGYQDLMVRVSGNKDKTKVRAVWLLFGATPLAAVKAKLEKQWGAPRLLNGRSPDAWAWDHPEGGWRVIAEGDDKKSKLEMIEVGGFDKFLAPDGKFGFEAKAPLLGVSAVDVLALPGAIQRDPTRIDLTFPSHDAASNPPQVSVTLADGKVTEWKVQLFTDLDVTGLERIKTALKARFGEPKRRESGVGLVDDYTGKGETATLDVSHEGVDYKDYGVTLTVKPAA